MVRPTPRGARSRGVGVVGRVGQRRSGSGRRTAREVARSAPTTGAEQLQPAAAERQPQVERDRLGAEGERQRPRSTTVSSGRSAAAARARPSPAGTGSAGSRRPSTSRSPGSRRRCRGTRRAATAGPASTAGRGPRRAAPGRSRWCGAGPPAGSTRRRSGTRGGAAPGQVGDAGLSHGLPSSAALAIARSVLIVMGCAVADSTSPAAAARTRCRRGAAGSTSRAGPGRRSR
jgi:hypothetical protein